MTEITFAKERMPSEIVETLHPLVKQWFFSKFKDFSLPQKYGVMSIHERKNILISAPTGGTKTLTAFLSILNYLVKLASEDKLENKMYAVYISPLKALSNDIHKNLVEPLKEIRALAELNGKKLQTIQIGLKTGDTSKKDKAKMAKYAPHILITTPESFAIGLVSKKISEYMKDIEFCIIDEIHSLGNKRGVDLSLSLERLNSISSKIPVKIGLSATVEPIEEVAKYLVGIEKDRKVEIARIPLTKEIDIEVLTPVENLIEDKNPHIPLYHLMHKLIQEHKTTLIFTNTRSATERVVHFLKEKFSGHYNDLNIAAHHSSLSKEHRFEIEEKLRKGELKVVVCSTSLELGIDIGYIDLVVLMGSPKASSRALQRIGRAGHKLDGVAKGKFIVMDRDDLIECSIIQKEMIEGKIDNVHFPKNCLDVLSQQIFGMAITKIWNIDEMLSTIRKSYCYQSLPKSDFLSVISYLSGDYELEKSKVFGKIWYDKEEKNIGKRGKLARVIYMTNLGTIPEESFVTVKLSPEGEQVGVIDEGFMNRMKKNDVFVLGGKRYQYKYTRGMNLYVRSAEDKSPTIPSWFSEMLPLSFESALEINHFKKLIKEKIEKGDKNILEFIQKHLYVGKQIAKEIFEYFNQQYKFSEIPHTNLLTIEKYVDERNDKKYLLVNSHYGRRVNDALSRALAYLMGIKGNRDIEIGITDRGFYLSGERMEIEKAIEELNSSNIEEILKEAIEKTDILAKRFRHCAIRSLMILRSYKGQRKSVKKQQLKSHFLISAVKKISREFPILNEAKREVLEDLMDIESAKKVLDWIKNKEITISMNYTKIPSPFALNLLLEAHLDLMRIEDKQEFLQRMHKIYISEIAKKVDYYDSSEWEEYLKEK